MIRLIISILISTFLLLATGSNGEPILKDKHDTITFQKKTNKEIKFQLPINEYYVFLKPKNENRKNVILTGYKDSILIMKVYSLNKEEKKIKHDKIVNINGNTSLKISQKDSLRKIILYFNIDSINICQVDKIIIPSRFRKEMKHKLNMTEWLAYSWLLIFPLTFFLESGVVFLGMVGLGIGICIYAIIIENKTISLDKWELAHLIH